MDNGASSYRRYLDGDEDAFREIVEEYFDGLLLFVNRYARNISVAEDIALDVFTQLVVHKHRYNFKTSFKTYLYVMGRSRVLDYIRRRDRINMVELSDADRYPSNDPVLEEVVFANQRKQTLHEALVRLPEQVRLVIHLVYFEDFSIDEAAKVLKKSRKQIYNLLYRGKTALRAILGEEGKLLL